MADPIKMEIGLNAAIVAMVDSGPAILRLESSEGQKIDALPYGRFDPSIHRTMEEGLRELAQAQTGVRPGYVEQLYTFGDRGRTPVEGDASPHVVSVGYLALAKVNAEKSTQAISNAAGWRNWYDYLPWEDWRSDRPAILDEAIIPALLEWADSPASTRGNNSGLDRLSRVRIAFGLEETGWDDDLVLDRYELLYAGGLVPEAVADGRVAETTVQSMPGVQMLHDHRRILATAIARLRSKLKYRPVIFELMPETFTLFDLQQTVESIFGRAIHKQNFRRLVEKAELVEPTGASERSTGGRPAALFRFRSEILRERPAPGLKIGKR